MSLTTWKKEFYSVSAKEIVKSGTDAELVEHALKKWRGLRKDSLDRHDLIPSNDGDIVDVQKNVDFEIDGYSCSLCEKFERRKPLHLRCTKCPIVRSGGHQCGHEGSAWVEWRRRQNPEPMIAVLEKTLEFVRRESCELECGAHGTYCKCNAEKSE